MYSHDTQALMDAAVDAVVVIDHRGRIQAVNDAVRGTFGYRADELLGQNVNLLMPEPDHSRHDGYLQRYLETGHARVIGVGREVTARRRDGSLFPVRLSVGRVPASSPARFVGLIRDITAERDATAALELERDRARAFLELHGSALVELDAFHRIREINSRGAGYLGGKVEGLLGRDWLEFMASELEREHAWMTLDAALGSGQSRERVFDCRDLNGGARRISWRCIGLRNADGTAAGWLCSGDDVTARLQAEQQSHLAKEKLTQVARLATVGEMAAGVAHEINQPLTAITAYARACERFLAMPQPDIAESVTLLREIVAEGLRAGDIIRRLRQMVRLDAPDIRSRIDVNRLVEELGALLESDARAHEVRLRTNLSPGLPAVTGNGLHLQQVILNLVRNGLEALSTTPPGERQLTISTVTDGDDGLEIRVDDTGPGVDPAIADQLFEPFSTTKLTGTGLGLTMSRTIVQSHGGSLVTRSLKPRGTRFAIRLPAAEEIIA